MKIDLSPLHFSESATALTKLWSGLPRKTGLFCPEKSSFSPVSLRQHLKSVFILERHGENCLRVRVAGSGIREHLGREITGLNLFDLLPTEHLYSYQAYYNNLRHYPCAGHVKRPATMTGGGRHLIQTMHLPLLDKEGEVSFFIGCVHVERMPMRHEEIKHGILKERRDLNIAYLDLGAGIPGQAAMAEPKSA